MFTEAQKAVGDVGPGKIGARQFRGLACLAWEDGPRGCSFWVGWEGVWTSLAHSQKSTLCFLWRKSQDVSSSVSGHGS
jgi:hypothetical protein